jgi:hypothetical protein
MVQHPTNGACCKRAFYKIVPHILGGEDTNFRVFSPYLPLLERGLLQKRILQQTHFMKFAGRMLTVA